MRMIYRRATSSRAGRRRGERFVPAGWGLESRTLLSGPDVPTTTAQVSGTLGQNGFYVSPVTVNLTATDSSYPANALTTDYSVNGAAFAQGTSIPLTGDGSYNVQYYSTNPGGGVEATHSLVVKIDDTAPAVSVNASPSSLWPPNGKYVTVHVTGRVSDDNLGSQPTISYHVQDEYGQVQPSGTNVPVASDGSYSFDVQLQARRTGQDKDGRTYTIDVVAHDAAGNMGTGSTTVVVPHDQGQGGGGGGVPDQNYVNALFQVLMGRSATAQEESLFEQWFEKGASASQVVSVLESTPEHEAREIEQLYETYLGRNADAGGLASFTAQMNAGATTSDVAKALIDSPEFNARHPSNTNFVAALYHDALGRAPDASGQAYFVGQLNAGASRATIAADVLFSTEKSQDAIDTAYATSLHHAADSGGLHAFVAVLQSHGHNMKVVYLDLLTSSEFMHDAS